MPTLNEINSRQFAERDIFDPNARTSLASPFLAFAQGGIDKRREAFINKNNADRSAVSAANEATRKQDNLTKTQRDSANSQVDFALKIQKLVNAGNPKGAQKLADQAADSFGTGFTIPAQSVKVTSKGYEAKVIKTGSGVNLLSFDKTKGTFKVTFLGKNPTPATQQPDPLDQQLKRQRITKGQQAEQAVGNKASVQNIAAQVGQAIRSGQFKSVQEGLDAAIPVLQAELDAQGNGEKVSPALIEKVRQELALDFNPAVPADPGFGGNLNPLSGSPAQPATPKF